MAKVYDKKINRNTDWGGDNSTGGLPVAGSRVQEFIKEQLSTHYGYSRIVDKKYLQMFADIESANLFDRDPVGNEDFLLASLQLPNTGATVASMRISVIEKPSRYYAPGIPQVFKFSYLSYYENEQDLSSVKGTLTYYVNGVFKGSRSLLSGEQYSVDVTPYLTTVEDEVLFTITNNEDSKRSYAYTVEPILLNISSSFNPVLGYMGQISFPYIPVGSAEKTIYFTIDGRNVATVTTSLTNREMTQILPAQRHGNHILQVFMRVSIDGVEVDSNVLRYDVICLETGNNTPIIASTFNRTEASQYDTLDIPFVVYDPVNNPTTVHLKVDNVTVSERSVNRTQQSWTHRTDIMGFTVLSISCGSTVRNFPIEVRRASFDVEAEKSGLSLYLTSLGRSNSDTNREIWEYGPIRTIMKNFNWSTNGWITDSDGKTCLRVGGGASVEIPLKVFSTDFRATGKTIEVEFSAVDVSNYGTTLLSCLQGGVGMTITPQLAKMSSSQSSVSTNYKDNERLRVSFVVDKRSSNRLFNAYVDGINSQSVQYPENDTFIQNSPTHITIGSTEATIDIYNIRVYDNNLNRYQLLNNYIADMDDIVKKELTYNRNQVYNSLGEIDINKVIDFIPCLEIIGDLPQYKGDKKSCKMRYIEKGNPDRSWVGEGITNDVQGTSSQYYPRKNYKFKLSKAGITFDNGQTSTMFQLNDDVLPASVFCTKADFAESSGTHNTGIANYADYVTKAMGLLTPPQIDNEKVRTTICGFPICIFQRATEEAVPEFIGKYNFNTDKAAENTFGFSEGTESWEFLNNTSELARFKSADFTNWKDTLEARYPEDFENIEKVKQVFEWVVSCGVDTEKFKAEVETYFDKRYLLFYYLFTFTFGMVDQRAKNQFLSLFSSWLFILYDNDTCLGINNEGAISFQPNVEIHDVIGSLNVWNGSDSSLWILVERAFPDEIAAMYSDMRQKGYLSYDKVMLYLDEMQSSKWSESIYNEDGYFKYEKPLVDGYLDYSQTPPVIVKTGTYLYALQGSREMNRKWWVSNRLFYLDTKYLAGDVRSDFATFRTYTPTEWSGVAPNADITVTPFVGMYQNIKWGSVTKGARAEANKSITIKAPAMTFNDTETIVYGASMIKSLGNLAPLYPGTVDVSKMLKLTELIIGSSVSGYNNTNFTVLSVGNNNLLKKLDITNCSGYTAPIDVSGCTGIEEIYAEGTSTTGVSLANGGNLRKMLLPETITNITLKNQRSIDAVGISLKSYTKVSTLVVENCPALDPLILSRRCLGSGVTTLKYIRLISIDARDNSLDTIAQLCYLNGIDDNGNYTDTAIITGKIHVSVASEQMLSLVEEKLPQLEVTYDNFAEVPDRTFTVTTDKGTLYAHSEILINDVVYTTDSNGSVTLTTGESLTVKIMTEGYAYFENFYAATSFTRTYSIKLLTAVVWTIRCEDTNRIPVSNVTVYGEAEGVNAVPRKLPEAVTGEDGTVRYSVLANHYYQLYYVYEGVTTSVEKVSTAEVTYIRGIVARDLPYYMPPSLGQVSFLLNSDGFRSFTTSFTVGRDGGTEPIIDWGDGETTPVTEGSKQYTHTYKVSKQYNVGITSAESVVSLSFPTRTAGGLLAFWSVGNSNIKNMSFYLVQGLAYVGEDVFINDINRTSFSLVFSGTEITSVPENLFFSCTAASRFDSVFEDTPLQSIPSKLFEKCTKATDFSKAFGSTRITSVPEELLWNCPEVTSVRGMFEGCWNLTTFPERFFEKSLKVSNFDSFLGGAASTMYPKISSLPSKLLRQPFTSEAISLTSFFGGWPKGFSENRSCDIPEGFFDDVAPKATNYRFLFNNFPVGHIPLNTLNKFTIPSSLDNFFTDCSRLTNVPVDFMEGLPDYNFNSSHIRCYSGNNKLRHYIVPKFITHIPGEFLLIGDVAKSIRFFREIPPNLGAASISSAYLLISQGVKIYVPDSAVDSYKKATNFTNYASLIKPMSDFEIDFPGE